MSTNTRDADEAPQTIEDEASSAFVQRLQGEWTDADQAAFETRLARDPAYADAYRRVEESWGVLDRYAETPELIARREKSLVYVRRGNARRWITRRSSGWRHAAVAAAVAVLVAIAWQLSPYGYQPGLYQTGVGEQRLIELEDHSRIALDAKTRLRIRYTRDARAVELQDGQAQFYVAQDAARPFKVRAGDQTIVALGTVFTVEYAERKVRVAMVEGRVAIRAPAATARQSNPAPTIELGAGEELRVRQDGRATVIVHADLESATAWREGKVIFRGERMDEAVRRLNRYSRVQIHLDDEALATREISGVFEAGDTQGFVGAVQRYYPVTTVHVGDDTIRLGTDRRQ